MDDATGYSTRFIIAKTDRPAIENRDDLVKWLDVTSLQLSTLIDPFTSHKDLYQSRSIPKRVSGTRLISIPRDFVMQCQDRINRDLLRKVISHERSMAYSYGVSTKHVAKQHSGQGTVIRIDLADFFHRITYQRIRSCIASFGYSDEITEYLATICTHPPYTLSRLEGRRPALSRRFLPQGSPTSPILSNMAARRLDLKLTSIFDGINYSRYADDIYFSHDGSEADFGTGKILGISYRVIREEGFLVNSSKTKVMRAPSRQLVCGIVVNDGVLRVPRSAIRNHRILLHRIEYDGQEAVSRRIGVDALAHANGFLSYVAHINPHQARRIWKSHPWLQLPKSIAT